MVTSVLRKKNLFIIGGLIFSLLLFTSCITTEEQARYFNDQIVAVNTRINELEKTEESMAAKLSGQIDSKLASIRDSQAEVGNDINSLRGEIRDLSGRVEENTHLVTRAIERDTTEQDGTDARLAQLTKRLAEVETSLKRLHVYVGLEPSGEVKKQQPEKALPEAALPKKQPKVVEEKPAVTDKQVYELTLATYREEEYEEALAGFRGFLEKYPTSDLADNAQFWIGECYMALKQYEQAILAYQEVIKKYPKGNKVPNAMLRQALAFYEIKDKISSRLLLKKIIREHPDSSEAKIAKARLEKF
jgi:tol-pal system protein YbgF